MEKIRAEKLSDDSLDQVTGGTNEEMFELQRAMGVSNIKKIQEGLLDKGIKSSLSSIDENRYTELRTGNSLSQEDVLKIIKS